MKKIISFILVFVMATMLVACGETNTSNEDTDVIKVGMELKWPPFETTDLDGKPYGISVMYAEELANYLGKEVEIVDLPFSSLITALETEKIDVIIGSMGITEEREQKINFSNPYMYFKLLPIVNTDSGIENSSDIFEKEGVTFVGPKSFMALDIARENANNPNILEFDDKAAATLELANGNADVFIVDAVSAFSIANNYDNLEVFYEPIEVTPIGVGIRKGDDELLNKVNEFISQVPESGLYEKVENEFNETLIESIGKGFEFYINEN